MAAADGLPVRRGGPGRGQPRKRSRACRSVATWCDGPRAADIMAKDLFMTKEKRAMCTQKLRRKIFLHDLLGRWGG
jgi:hypothetical protein